MKQTLIRILGTVVILAALWLAIGASIALVLAVSKLIIPRDEWMHAYRYGAWIDVSIWIGWGLSLMGTISAIRTLFRRTRSPSEREPAE